MRRSYWKILGLTTCTLIGLAGVSTALAQDKPAEKPKAEEKKPEAKQEEKKGEKTLLETIAADKNFSTFNELLTEAGLPASLKGDGPYTVFAPTNAAFDKLGKDTVDGLKKDKAKLTSILKYHIHSGKLTAADVSKAKTITTLNGADLTVTVKDKDVMVDKSKVSMTDIKAKNGVILAVDTVAMPSEKKPEKPKG